MTSTDKNIVPERLFDDSETNRECIFTLTNRATLKSIKLTTKYKMSSEFINITDMINKLYPSEKYKQFAKISFGNGRNYNISTIESNLKLFTKLFSYTYIPNNEPSTELSFGYKRLANNSQTVCLFKKIIPNKQLKELFTFIVNITDDNEQNIGNLYFKMCVKAIDGIELTTDEQTPLECLDLLQKLEQ
jgi:hypothetical protein